MMLVFKDIHRVEAMYDSIFHYVETMYEEKPVQGGSELMNTYMMLVFKDFQSGGHVQWKLPQGGDHVRGL